MTTKQTQALLHYLGYDPGVVDGIMGAKTQKALDAFSRDYGVGAEGLLDAVVGNVSKLDTEVATGDWWGKYPNFSRREFACPCGKCGGYPAEPKEALVAILAKVRDHFDAPVLISSGVRCQAHNDSLSGSVPNSRHIQGKAADFCVRGMPGSMVLAYAKTLSGVHYTYQISGCDYIHLDVD